MNPPREKLDTSSKGGKKKKAALLHTAVHNYRTLLSFPPGGEIFFFLRPNPRGGN